MPKARWAATLLALGLLIGACSGTDVGQSSTSVSPVDDEPVPATSIATPDPSPLAWADCGDGTDCSTLTVPLDYGAPHGETVDLAVARKHSTGAEPVGALIVNPGGPGNSGVDYVRSGAIDDLRPWFDIVSWDPRGVGGSRPLRCVDDQSFFTMDPSPNDQAAKQDLEAAARAIADDCATADPALLPTLTTATAARDMEQLRRALGGAPLNYLGFSYGTHIGIDYARLFPDQIRAMVLDGVVDPRESLGEFLTGQAIEIERVVSDNLDLYRDVASSLEVEPIATRSGSAVGPGTLGVGTVSSIYETNGQQELHRVLQDARNGDGTALQKLADQYLDGGSFAGYLGVLCIDSPHPAGADVWWPFIDQITSAAPEFGPGVGNELLPCAYWPIATDANPDATNAEAKDYWPANLPPILLVGATQDVATPLNDAGSVNRWVPNSVLLVRDGAGHTSFGVSSCVQDAVQTYLVERTPPDEGTVCAS